MIATMNSTTNNDPHRWKTLTSQILYVMGVLASLVLIASISIEAFSSNPFHNDTIYTRIQFWICIYFLVDFFLLLVLAPRPGQFFLRNFILIFISIPYSTVIDHYALNLSHEVVYLIRFLPIIRGGAALVVLVKLLVGNRITGLLIAYLAIFFSVTYFQTLIFYVFEAGMNPQVKSYPDALWWASMTVTTVGSNIIPVTTIGKICTAALAVVGMTIFPIFTVYITSIVQNLTTREKSRTA